MVATVNKDCNCNLVFPSIMMIGGDLRERHSNRLASDVRAVEASMSPMWRSSSVTTS